MKTVLITGGTGLVGKALTKHLMAKGYAVIILTRALPKDPAPVNCSYSLWNVEKQEIDVVAVQKADYIVHLAGAGVVDKKWTDAYKKQIIESRTKSSELIIKTLKDNTNKVVAIISASATGWYAPDTSNAVPHVETDSPDDSFLGETCRLWEQSIEPATALGKRVVKLRTGIVLSNDGGALAEFKKPLTFGVAAILGSGKQIVSWIHIDDLCALYIYAMENENFRGSYNAVAPAPVSNKMLTLTLAKIVKGNFFIAMHVPAFVLRIMMGGRSIEILKSTTVSCKKITDAGFTFDYLSIEDALKNLKQ